MRLAAASIAAAGALFGIFRAFIVLVYLMVTGLSLGGLTRVDFVLLGTEAAGALLSVVGPVGAGLLVAEKDRISVLLMLGTAVGIVLVFAIQPFVVNLAVSAQVRPQLEVPPISSWIGSLVPTVALFLAAAILLLLGRAERPA